MNEFPTMAPALHRAVPLRTDPEPIYSYRFSMRWFLVQMFFCTIPAAALIATGRVELAGKCFWLLLCLVLSRVVLMGRRDELLCLLLATAPFLSLLRSYVFYNVILVTFIGVLGFYYFSASGRFRQTLRQVGLFWGVIIWAGTYYALSFYNTGNYSINLRLFELAFTIFCILLVSRNRLLLAAALTGNIVSAWMVGLSMLPQMGTSGRLGIIVSDGQMIGNPGQLGLPLAFGFLALMFDHGRWLNLQDRPLIRWCMLALTTVLLALTTSRASWLVAAIGIFMLFLFGKKQRRILLVTCGVGVVAIGLVMMTPYSGAIKKGWERTFGEGQSVRKKTSGRSDQWLVAQYAFTRSISATVHGYGPGLGPQIYARYSPEVPGAKYAVGKKVALHSLFMQMMVEAGVVGLFLFSGWLLAIFAKLVGQLRHHGVFPLACFFGYILTVISISGSDINSGILLGMALLGTAKAVSPSQVVQSRQLDSAPVSER